jgi:hypothetical protein
MEKQKLFNNVAEAAVLQRLLIEKINVPRKSTEVSTLGGVDNVSIILKLSLDPKESWQNGILHNSRYGMFHICNTGKVECFSGESFRGFRSSTAKTFAHVILKIDMAIIKALSISHKS